MIDPFSDTIVRDQPDVFASNSPTWQREPIVADGLPAEARPIFARWYAELAVVNDAIGKGREAEYCREMAAQFGWVPS